MYELQFTTRFKRDFKKIQKRSLKDVELIIQVIDILRIKGVSGIPSKMLPHKLKGIYKGNWECHIKPDLLIVWLQIEDLKSIKLVRIGSHSDLFN